MTLFGIALAVFATVFILSLSRGLYLRTSATGSAKNILALSRKGKSVMFGDISDEELAFLTSLPGLAKNVDDKLLISPEIMHVTQIEIGEGDNRKRAPLSIRGVNSVAYDVHKDIRIIEGRLPEDDFEIMVGKTAHIRLKVSEEVFAIDENLVFENEEWEICGRFEAADSMNESEIWTTLNSLKTQLKRRTCSFVVMTFTDEAAARKNLAEFRQSGATSRYFKGWIEQDYYREFSKTLQWVVWISFFLVAATIIAGVLIGLNTMYTSIINRMREFGTLRVLGFGKTQILAGLLIESVLISLLAGVIGVICGTIANGIPLKLANSAFYLVVDSRVVLIGLGMSLLIGVFGAILPGWRGANTAIMDLLRSR